MARVQEPIVKGALAIPHNESEVVTRHTKRTPAQRVTRHKRANAWRATTAQNTLPVEIDEELPPSPKGFYFRADGKGFECRRAVKEGGTRKIKYFAHLSRQKWVAIKHKHPTTQTKQQAIEQWITARLAEKKAR